MFAKVKFKANPCHKKFISLHLWNNARVHCKTPAPLLSALEKSSPRHSQAVGQWRCRRHFHSRRCPPRLVVRLLLRRSPQKKSDSRSFREGKRATRNCWEFACWYSDYVTLLQIIIHWPQRPKAGISEATIHSWSLWYIHLTTPQYGSPATTYYLPPNPESPRFCDWSSQMTRSFSMIWYWTLSSHNHPLRSPNGNMEGIHFRAPQRCSQPPAHKALETRRYKYAAFWQLHYLIYFLSHLAFLSQNCTVPL